MLHVEVSMPDVKVSLEKFYRDPVEAFDGFVHRWRDQFAQALTTLMDAEMELFLGKTRELGTSNSRNGYLTRRFTIKGIGTLAIRVPRDRRGHYASIVLPPRQRYDVRIQEDMALLHLGGMSTRTIALMSERLFGRKLSAQEVSESTGRLHEKVNEWRQRPLDRQYRYLYLDGSIFRIRRGDVGMEPVLVVIGVDMEGCRQVLGFQSGDKESATSWDSFLGDLIERGLNAASVELGMMDGLSGLETIFHQRFTKAQVQRCQIHKLRNILAKVPKRFHEEMKPMVRKVFYNESRSASEKAFKDFKETWERRCPDGVRCLEKDLSSLLAFYDFPKEHWPSLRTTNPIERLNKEYKRRTKSMEIVGGENSMYTLLAFISMKMELSWQTSRVGSKWFINLPNFSLTHKT